jgi:hypothetical protein
MTQSISFDKLRLEQNEEVQELHRQLKEKDNILRNYRKEHGKLEVFFRQVADSAPKISPLPIKYTPTKKKSKATAVAVAQTSDSHMGAVQDYDEVEGLNVFNPDICRARNIGFTKGFINYFEVQRNAYNINELHWLFTGDLVSGDIHGELLVTNAFPTPVQVVEAAKLHALQVAMAASYFDTIHVHFLVADNHSRLTRKPQASEAGLNSFNYIVGMMMKEMLAAHGNVIFNIYPQTEKVVAINGIQYLLTHGHTIQGWMGVPWYGIERKVGKESTARLAAIMREQQDVILKKMKEIGFHKLCHGHFHVNFDSELFCCAASIQGTTAYDHNNARFSEPGQPAWLIGSHGELARTNFKLKYYDHEIIAN